MDIKLEVDWIEVLALAAAIDFFFEEDSEMPSIYEESYSWFEVDLTIY